MPSPFWRGVLMPRGRRAWIVIRSPDSDLKQHLDTMTILFRWHFDGYVSTNHALPSSFNGDAVVHKQVERLGRLGALLCDYDEILTP